MVLEDGRNIDSEDAVLDGAMEFFQELLSMTSVSIEE